MSEEDYHRGRRGGDAKVSISDWERWKDWKAGHDEWEEEQDNEDVERALEAGDQDLINRQMLRRELERQRQEGYIKEEEQRYRERENNKKQEAAGHKEITTSIVVASLFAVIGFFKGCSSYIAAFNRDAYYKWNHVGEGFSSMLYPFIGIGVGFAVGWILVKIVFLLIRNSK